jgi:uncharacterized protein
MRRILALDGGGIRGVFTLEVLVQIQRMLREHTKNPALLLSDHFEFIAGTSTGAIIAAGLSWGMDVEKILDIYVEHGKTMFQRVPWYRPIKRMFVNRFQAQPLSDLLQRMFSEDGDGKKPSLLSTDKLKTLLLVVVRNETNGSAWPLTNNPKAKYNDITRPDCNLLIPLWKVVRASTAAPVYFPPEHIQLGERIEIFVDGGITAYNNPALIAAMTAILPCYNLKWQTGPEQIRLISIGTIRILSAGFKTEAAKMTLAYNLPRIPMALMQGIAQEQDFVCRCIGQCLHGDDLDSEIGDLIEESLPGPKLFSYVRYNKSYKGKEAEAIALFDPDLAKLDAVQMIPRLREIGRAYAEENVRLEHLI